MDNQSGMRGAVTITYPFEETVAFRVCGGSPSRRRIIMDIPAAMVRVR
jgi:hypothetical protein